MNAKSASMRNRVLWFGLFALAFAVTAVWWFVQTAKSDGTLAIGNAFAGLGYFAATLGVALLVLLIGLGVAALRSNGWHWSSRGRRPTDDRAIVRVQLAWGAILVIVGAIIGVICLCFIHPRDEVAGPVLALATAVIGAGATLLPAGAAGSASARMAQGVSDNGNLPVAVTTSVSPDPAGTKVTGIVAPNRAQVNAYFEYQDAPEEGKPEAPIAKTTPPEAIAADVPSQEVTQVLKTLDGGKAYRVRVVAETPANKRGEGSWLEFTTPAAPAA